MAISHINPHHKAHLKMCMIDIKNIYMHIFEVTVIPITKLPTPQSATTNQPIWDSVIYRVPMILWSRCDRSVYPENGN